MAYATKHSRVCKSSGEKTSSAIINTGAALLCHVIVLTDGTNDATIILYDNTSAAGTKLFEAKVLGSSVRMDGEHFTFPIPVVADNGIYASITGTGASCIVGYVPQS